MAEPRKVNLATIVDPQFVTLTKSPANQVAFKALRSDGDIEMNTPQRRRVRRSDSLVAVNFTAGTDEATVQATMVNWGVTEYTLEVSDSGTRAVIRSDVEAGATMDVALPDGLTATVLKPISNQTSDGKAGVSVARMDFAIDAFPDLADVEAWLVRNDIPVESVKITRGDTVTSVVRIDSTDADVRVLNVESGVDFQVIRSDSSDIPSNFVTVVSDTAYGGWGWGQLDFSAALADRQFCELTEEASYMLRRVLDQIIFYGEVPLEARKVLVKNAVNQYADYVIALMTGLPSKVVLATRSSNTKEKAVNTADKSTVARTDAKKTDDASVTSADSKPADSTSITRADVSQMIQEAIGGFGTQLTNIEALLAQRNDATPAAPEASATPATAEGTGDDASAVQRSDAQGKPDEKPSLEQVMRSMGELSTTLKTVQESVAQIQSTSVIRSDAADDAQGQTNGAGEKRDVFRGMFASRKQ